MFLKNYAMFLKQMSNNLDTRCILVEMGAEVEKVNFINNKRVFFCTCCRFCFNWTQDI